MLDESRIKLFANLNNLIEHRKYIKLKKEEKNVL